MDITRILILGGARSGKSRFALKVAESKWRRPLYVATAEALDREMTERIAAHKKDRGKRWACTEEPLEIARLINRAGEAPRVPDSKRSGRGIFAEPCEAKNAIPPCGSLLCHSSSGYEGREPQGFLAKKGKLYLYPARDVLLIDCLTLWLNNVLFKEGLKSFKRRKADLLKAVRNSRHSLIMVSNEVGLGIVPESEAGRQFRDLAGWLNQDIASVADTVVFVAAGLPLIMKGKLP